MRINLFTTRFIFLILSFYHTNLAIAFSGSEEIISTDFLVAPPFENHFENQFENQLRNTSFNENDFHQPDSKDVTRIVANKKIIVPVQKWTEVKIKNIGNINTALNVHAILPEEWSELSQDASDCFSIKPGESCTLKLFSPVPYVVDYGLRIVGDNVNTLYVPLAFSVEDYLVFDVNFKKRLASVVDNQELSPSPWGQANLRVGSRNIKHGKRNTYLIMNSLDTNSSSAASQCYLSTAGNTSIGTWYLPAICQMSPDCKNKQSNIQSNLIDQGFLNDLNGYYWSSSERNATEAKAVYYDMRSLKIYYDKSFPYFQVLCVRDIRY